MTEILRGSQPVRPRFEDIQAHHDLSDAFFALFQDASRTYSCAYFDPPDLALQQAQLAKIDIGLTLSRNQRSYAQRLLDAAVQ